MTSSREGPDDKRCHGRKRHQKQSGMGDRAPSSLDLRMCVVLPGTAYSPKQASRNIA